MASPQDTRHNALTPDDVTALAHRLHRIRESWHVGSLVTLLARLADVYDGATLTRAAVAAASDAHIKTPAGIEWTVADVTTKQQQATTNEPCNTCGKPPDKCRWERVLVRNGSDYDDHVYVTAAEARAQAAKTRKSA